MSDSTGSTAAQALLSSVQFGLPRTRWLTHVLATVEMLDDEPAYYTLLRVGHVLSWGSISYAVRHIREPASDTTWVALALYCLLRFEDSPQKQQQQAVLLDDEAESLVRQVHAIEEENANTR